jgi:hypothetical protein
MQNQYLEHVEAQREGMQIICVPDHKDVLAYALGFICSEVHINEHDERFRADGEGLLVNDHLAVTRLFDLDEASDGLDVAALPDLASHEIWVVDRPRGFGQSGAAVAISGPALRQLLSQARPMWATLKLDIKAMRGR